METNFRAPTYTIKLGDVLTLNANDKADVIQIIANQQIPGAKLTDNPQVMYLLGTMYPEEVFVFNIRGTTYVRVQNQIPFENGRIPKDYFHKPLGNGTNLNVLKTDRRNEEQRIFSWLRG